MKHNIVLFFDPETQRYRAMKKVSGMYYEFLDEVLFDDVIDAAHYVQEMDKGFDEADINSIFIGKDNGLPL